MPEIRQVPRAELVHINVDLTYATGVALGAVPAVMGFRADLRCDANRHDPEAGRATKYADAAYDLRVAKADRLRELHEEGTALRDLLHGALAMGGNPFIDGPIRRAK